MPALHEIPRIEKGWLDLLDGAGIRDAAHLAQQDPGELVDGLQRANQVLGISTHPPQRALVEEWIADARELLSTLPAEAGSQYKLPANYEANHEVASMLARSPFAIPLPGKALKGRRLGVADVPAGLLLNRYSGNLDVRIEEPSNMKAEVPTRRGATRMEKSGAARMERTHFDASSVKVAVPDTHTRVPESKKGHDHDRVALIRAPREKTNRGKDPSSRRYIRGVLHTHPWTLRIGAVFSLLLLLDLPLAIVSAFLLLFSRENPEFFSWVPKWILAFPIALPVIGLGYLIFGVSGKCRICTQKLFVHKGALKHVKSHRLPGLGYVVPLCLHLLLFSWFRCSSCGTPVRLKK